MANLSVEFNFQGFKELEKLMQKSTKVEQEVRRVVKSNGNELKNRMVRKADFNKGYQTGTTKRSIQEHIENGGKVSVALLDIVMPGISGIDVAKK